MAPTSTASVFSSSIFSSSSLSLSRPTTRDGGPDSHAAAAPSGLLSKDRKTSFTRKASLSNVRRRGTWTAASAAHGVVTDANTPPALPDYALAAAAKVVSRDKDGERERERERDRERDKHGRDAGEGPWSPIDSPRDLFHPLSRTTTANTPITTTTTTTTTHMAPPTQTAPVGASNAHGSQMQHSESTLIHQQIIDLAQKRISTLDYLRKAHEGRIYWFNTYLLDRPDFNRMPGFDPRKLARKATNYLLLGLSIPTINNLYSSTPLEFLRCLNGLLSEFDSFQQLHGEHPPSAASLTRARLPSMFRRPGAKTRRSVSTSASSDAIIDDTSASAPTAANFSAASLAPAAATTTTATGAAAGGAPSSSSHSTSAVMMNFAAAESDLLPGEEYTYLLTPSLPFEPDFFETFATLCDVLIDCYTGFLALVPTSREVSAQIADLFTKADSRMRKIVVQGIIKELEDHSRTNVKTEVAGIGKIILGGLM